MKCNGFKVLPKNLAREIRNMPSLSVHVSICWASYVLWGTRETVDCYTWLHILLYKHQIWNNLIPVSLDLIPGQNKHSAGKSYILKVNILYCSENKYFACSNRLSTTNASSVIPSISLKSSSATFSSLSSIISSSTYSFVMLDNIAFTFFVISS